MQKFVAQSQKSVLKSSLRGFATGSLKKCAVVLSGCGAKDGTETTEAASCLIALTKYKVPFQCFSISKDMAEVVNMNSGELMDEKRDVLVESARISRANCQDLKDINVEDYDAILIPGGWGIGKNFSDFVEKGEDFSLDPVFDKVLKEFHAKGRKLGFACVTPIIASRCFGKKFGGPGVKITLGGRGDGWPNESTIDIAEGYGNTLELNDAMKVTVDTTNHVYSTPCFMRRGSTNWEIYQGIDNLVKEMVEN